MLQIWPKALRGQAQAAGLCALLLSPSSHPALQQHRPLSQGQGQGQLSGSCGWELSPTLIAGEMAAPSLHIYISQHISRCSKMSLPALMEKACP